MSKVVKKDLLLDCTMRAVAENGLMDVSMQMITKMAGTAEGLIYKHYGTKENLLLQCYLSLYGEIRDCIEDGLGDPCGVENREELFLFLRRIWTKYFAYLIGNRYKTLYLYEYRNSSYMKEAAMSGKIDPKDFFKKTVELFNEFDRKFGILHKIDIKWFFYYVTDVSVVFAIRMINEEKECDEKLLDTIWNLIWGGEFWLISK